MQRFKERINDQLFVTIVQVNNLKLSFKEYPLLARLFGKKNVSDEKENDDVIYKETEIHTCIYRGIIYIYREIIIKRTKMYSSENVLHDQGFYQEMLNNELIYKNKKSGGNNGTRYISSK